VRPPGQSELEAPDGRLVLGPAASQAAAFVDGTRIAIVREQQQAPTAVDVVDLAQPSTPVLQGTFEVGVDLDDYAWGWLPEQRNFSLLGGGVLATQLGTAIGAIDLHGSAPAWAQLSWPAGVRYGGPYGNAGRAVAWHYLDTDSDEVKVFAQ